MIGVYRVIELLGWSAKRLMEIGERREFTQCKAWVQDASNMGPERMGSSTIGLPNMGCCS